MFTSAKYRMIGVSMVELIIFIVVVAVAVAGILPALNLSARTSPFPIQRKQAIAIGESLLTEIEQQNFTYCDPEDPNVLTATSTASCAGTSQDNGGGALTSVNYPVATAESRGSTTWPYDNVADYAGGVFQGDITGANIVTGYSSKVVITRVGGGVAPFNTGIATVPGDILQIQVIVTYPGPNQVTLVGYRFRYAPNAAG